MKNTNNMNRLLTICLILCFGSVTFAQQYVCGLPGGEEDTRLIERLKSNKAYLAAHPEERSTVVRYVNIVFHNIKSEDGIGGVADDRIYELMCNLNRYYLEQGVDIQFILDDIAVIKDDVAYENHYTDEGRAIFRNKKRPRVINIYLPRDANTNSQSNGTTLGYFSPTQDWIVLKPGEVNGTSSTVLHEIGHYFSLPHPFRGWDFDAYDREKHGVQVSNFSPSINFNPPVLSERQNGSNCNVAGDLICDTPPDYNHLNWNGGCNYNEGTKDPIGTITDPDETNVMSYFSGCSIEIFSEDQKAIMNADLTQRTATGDLNLQPAPSVSIGDAPITFNGPINDEPVADNAEILFDWEDVPNADTYLFVVDRFSNFGFRPQRFTLTESQVTIDGSDFFVNQQYFWKVKAVNSYDHCNPWSEDQTFTSSTFAGVSNISGVEGITFMPNPVQVGLTANLVFESKQSFQANATIINMNGVVLAQMADQKIIQGANTMAIPTADMAAGVYFLRIASELGTIQEKFIVQ